MVTIILDREKLEVETESQIPSLKKLPVDLTNQSYQLVTWAGKVSLFQELRTTQPLLTCFPEQVPQEGTRI